MFFQSTLVHAAVYKLGTKLKSCFFFLRENGQIFVADIESNVLQKYLSWSDKIVLKSSYKYF